MTPIRQNLDSLSYALSAFNTIAYSNPFSKFNRNILGDAHFRRMAAFGNVAADVSLFGSMMQMQQLNNQLSAISAQLPAAAMTTSAFTMPAMPAMNFNFNFPTFTMPSFNFGSLLTNRPSMNFSASSTKAQRALQVASSQIGVREATGNNDGAQINEYRNGKADGSAWCASFVSYCYGRGQGTDNSKTFGYDASSQSIRRKAQNAGYYQKARTNYTPKAGDVAVWSNGDGTGHVGIVTKTNADGSFETIEGNCSNQVARVTRRMSDAKLDGFVQMNEWLEA
ncbi:CHAP domain-containing protein [bacterium]|nr:CHAP domain-containing protein [bacterium]